MLDVWWQLRSCGQFAHTLPLCRAAVSTVHEPIGAVADQKKKKKKKKKTERGAKSSHGRIEKHELFENVFYCTVANLGRIVRRGSTLVRVPFFFFLIAVPWCDCCVSRLHQCLLLPIRGQCQDINFPCDGLSPPPPLPPLPPPPPVACSTVSSALSIVVNHLSKRCSVAHLGVLFFFLNIFILSLCVCLSLSQHGIQQSIITFSLGTQNQHAACLTMRKWDNTWVSAVEYLYL